MLNNAEIQNKKNNNKNKRITNQPEMLSSSRAHEKKQTDENRVVYKSTDEGKKGRSRSLMEKMKNGVKKKKKNLV